MARIPYNGDVQSADTIRERTPEASPSDFGGNAGVLMGEAEQQVAQKFYDVQQRMEVSSADVAAARARQQWTNELTQRVARGDASQPDFADKFTQDVTNGLSNGSAGLGTGAGMRAWAQHSAEIASNLSQSAHYQQAQAETTQTVKNYQDFVDAHRNTLVNDPTQFDSVMRDVTGSLNNPDSPYARMPATKKAELEFAAKNAMAQSAVEGSIRIDPQGTLDDLTAGKWDSYLSGNQGYMMQQKADIAIRGRQMEQARIEALADKAQKKVQEATENSVIKDIFSDNPKMTATDISTNNNLSPQQKLTMLAVQARSVKPDPMAEVSQATTMRLFPFITLPDGDPRKMVDNTEINKEFAAGNLSKPDYNWLQTLITQAKTPEGDSLVKRQSDFMRDYGAQLDHSTLANIDGEGKSRAYNFNFYVNQMVQQYRHEGKNPYDLFDPSKPDFLGKPDVVQSFTAPLDRQAENLANRLRASTAAGAVPQRLPGETIDAWRARTAAQGAK